MYSKINKTILGVILTAALAVTGFLPVNQGYVNAETTFTQYHDDSYDYWIYNDGTAEIRNYKGNAEKVIIPSEVNGNKIVSIVDAFRHNKSLKEVVIPDTIKKLQGAFASCPALEKVTLSENISYMNTAFNGCTSLKTITIPAGYSQAFDYNEGDGANFVGSGIKSVIFEEGTTAVHANMFLRCSSLESVQLPDTVKIIGSYAFANCDKLVMDLPKNLEFLGDHAFYYAKSITKLTIPKTFKRVTETIYGSFEGTSLKEVKIEEGVTIIPKNLFKGCSLIKEIDLPNSVVEIGDNAFDGCTGMETLRLYDSVRTIGVDPFKTNFPNIKNIYLTVSEPGKTMMVGGLLGTGTNKHTFVSDNEKVVTINTNQAILTFTGTGEATIKDSSGKAKRVLHVKVEGAKTKLSDCKLTLPQTSFTATGLPIAARVLAYDKKVLMQKNRDYTITYENNIKVGKASVTLTGKGNYTGSVTLEYQLVPIANSISDITVSGKSVTVAWNSVKDISGYELYYSTKENGSYNKLAEISESTSYTTTKLSTGMYVKIRCYQTVSGKKYYSGFSQAHKI